MAAKHGRGWQGALETRENALKGTSCSFDFSFEIK